MYTGAADNVMLLDVAMSTASKEALIVGCQAGRSAGYEVFGTKLVGDGKFSIDIR
jgi:hypothetical protein